MDRSSSDAAHPDTLQLDAYSRAARLSFFLWNASPDRELLSAAQSGKLMTPAGLSQQVDRLLNSPRLEDGMRTFFVDMLAFGGLDSDPGIDALSIDTGFYPKFTANVQADAEEQTLRTIVDATGAPEKSRFAKTSSFTPGWPPLASVTNSVWRVRSSIETTPRS